MVKAKDGRRENGLLSLSVDLREILKSQAKKNFSVIEIMADWQNIVGEEMASALTPFALKGKRLHLTALSGAAALEAEMMQEAIIGRINTFFGRSAVDSLKITQAPENPSSGEGGGGTAPSAPSGVALDPQALSNIEDEGLREALFSLAKWMDGDNNG